MGEPEIVEGEPCPISSFSSSYTGKFNLSLLREKPAPILLLILLCSEMLPELVEGKACDPILLLILLHSEVLPELVEGEACAPSSFSYSYTVRFYLSLLREMPVPHPPSHPLLQEGVT